MPGHQGHIGHRGLDSPPCPSRGCWGWCSWLPPHVARASGEFLAPRATLSPAPSHWERHVCSSQAPFTKTGWAQLAQVTSADPCPGETA